MNSHGKNRFFRFITIVMVLLFLYIIVPSKITSSFIDAPRITLHCNVNLTFIEENLCDHENCSPQVKKYESVDWYYVGPINIYILEDGKTIYIYPMTYDNRFSYYNFSNDVEVFLIQACDPDIAPVLNYVRNNNFTIKCYDFYPYNPKEISDGNITQIDDTWYLVSYPYVPSESLLLEDYIIGALYQFFFLPFMLIMSLFFIVTMESIIISLFLLIGSIFAIIYFSKKHKAGWLYLLPLFFGFIGGLIGFIAAKYVTSDYKQLGKMLLKFGLFINFMIFISYLILSVASRIT